MLSTPSAPKSVQLSGLIGMVALMVASGFLREVSAQGGSGTEKRTNSAVYTTWDPGGTILGQSALLRNTAGLSATFQTSQLPPGQAVTLWFIVFNNPWNCATNPCGPDDLVNPAVQGDFLWANGNIVGGSGRGAFAGRLGVGDTSGSGFIELGMPQAAVGLLNPLEAEVHLALHSHGPASTGLALKHQITSFLGGCAAFLGGADGIADGPGDIPANPGECSTFQISIHQ